MLRLDALSLVPFGPGLLACGPTGPATTDGSSQNPAPAGDEDVGACTVPP